MNVVLVTSTPLLQRVETICICRSDRPVRIKVWGIGLVLVHHCSSWCTTSVGTDLRSIGRYNCG